MNARPLLTLLVTSATFAACASAGPSGSPAVYARSATSTGYAAPASVSAPQSYGRSASVEVSSTSGGSVMQDVAPSAPQGEPGGAVNVPPEARPGLATEWGETRYSSMSYAPFVRASSAPYDMATIHYNDARLAAMQAMMHSARPVQYRGMYRDGVRVSLRDEGGSALPGYFAGDTVYVLGNAGQRYTILIENMTNARFEAVVSVDGLDVINGRPAATGSRGYILQAHGRVEVEGFRQNHDEVASFRFGSVGDSYAAQTGDARNVGVIGVALFAERGATLDLEQNELQLREQANPFPGGFSAPPPRRYY